MLGSKVFVRYNETVDGKVEQREATGIVSDKVRVSVVHNGDVLINDNYLIIKEDGSCLVLHPTCILKVDKNVES